MSGSGGEARTWFATAAGDEAAAEVAVTADEARLGGASARIGPGPGEGRVLVRHAGRSAVAFAARRDGVWEIEIEGRSFTIRVDDERMHRLRALTAEIGPAAGPRELRAPMPGLIVRVAVASGDAVRVGDGLVVMEAMKMENELRAEREGVVAEVRVAEGATVERDQVLVTFDVEST